MSSTFQFLDRFQYHRISQDESNNPILPQIAKIGKKISQLPHVNNSSASIAFHFGKRMIITKKNANIDHLQRNDIIEIIDVDPVKNTSLYFGPSPPPLISPILWMIGYAKKEIQYLIFLEKNREKNREKDSFSTSITNIKKEDVFIEMIKSILKQLRKQEIILINTDLLILTAQTEEQMYKNIKIIEK